MPNNSESSQERVMMNEYAIIQEIARSSQQTQRELSRKVRLSLGMTNILLLRLVRKGYVKIKQLDWKRTEYLLTPKGSMEKTRKSLAYTMHTLRLFQCIVQAVQKQISTEYKRGDRKITIVAWPETAAAVSRAIAEMGLQDLEVRFVTTFKELGGRSGLIFIATEEKPPEPAENQRFVPLLDAVDLKFQYPE